MKKTKRIEYLKRDAEALKEELKTGDFAKERNIIHANLTIEQKLRVLEITEVFGPTKAEQLTGVSDKNIFRWKAAGVNNLVRKSGSGRKVQFPLFEKSLLEYYKTIRNKGMGLSTRRFIIYCRAEAKKDKNITIKFSRGWLQKFMKRNKISIRRKSTTIQKPVEELNAAIDIYRKEIYDIIFDPQSIYDHDHIVNIDETGVPRDASPVTTMEDIGKKHVIIASGGKEKEKLTTVVTITLMKAIGTSNYS